MPFRTRSLRNASSRERRRSIPYTSSRVQRRSRASRWYSSPTRRSNDASSSSPDRRSAQIAAAAARASVTPPVVASLAAASPCVEAAPLSLARPIIELLSSHPRVIGGKIVDDGTLGMLDVPDTADRCDTVHTESTKWRDVLWDDATDRDDGNATVSHETLEERWPTLIA